MLAILKKILSSYIKTSGKMKFYLIILFGIISAILGSIEPILFTKVISEIENFYNTGIFNYDTTIKFIIIWAIFIVITIFFQYVDRIFVLENGKLVEQGSYSELMKQKKKFYNLANPDKLILG